MIKKIIAFFSSTKTETDSLEYKFYNLVSSSYFNRLIISWIFWNWKIVFLLFFVSEDLIKDEYGYTINRIEWINLHYSPWYISIGCLLIGPAITAWVLFMVLEFFNVHSFRAVKWSWYKRVAIAKKFEEKTPTIGPMVSVYMEAKDVSNSKIVRLNNELVDNESRHKELLEKYNTQKEEISFLQVQYAELKLKQMADQDKGKAEGLKKMAEEAIAKIHLAPDKDQIFTEFYDVYRKITRTSNNKCVIGIPSPILGLLVNMGIFSKNQETKEYSVSKMGEYFNELLILGSAATVVLEHG